MKDRITEKPRGFGFVTFKEQEAADRAFLDEHVLDGRTVSNPACHSTAVSLRPTPAERDQGSETGSRQGSDCTGGTRFMVVIIRKAR
jgi:RNA recognition motif-containing protein